MAGIGFTPCRSMTAEDIRDLQRRARHPRRALGRRLGFIELAGDVLQWAHDIADRPGGDLQIERRALDLGMTKRS